MVKLGIALTFIFKKIVVKVHHVISRFAKFTLRAGFAPQATRLTPLGWININQAMEHGHRVYQKEQKHYWTQWMSGARCWNGQEFWFQKVMMVVRYIKKYSFMFRTHGQQPELHLKWKIDGKTGIFPETFLLNKKQLSLSLWWRGSPSSWEQTYYHEGLLDHFTST